MTRNIWVVKPQCPKLFAALRDKFDTNKIPIRKEMDANGMTFLTMTLGLFWRPRDVRERGTLAANGLCLGVIPCPGRVSLRRSPLL